MYLLGFSLVSVSGVTCPFAGLPHYISGRDVSYINLQGWFYSPSRLAILGRMRPFLEFFLDILKAMCYSLLNRTGRFTSPRNSDPKRSLKTKCGSGSTRTTVIEINIISNVESMRERRVVKYEHRVAENDDDYRAKDESIFQVASARIELSGALF